MNIAVIGAAGKSGQAFIDIALQQGHTVIAGARNDLADNRVTYKYCDATDATSVAELIKEADAIVSVVGHGKKSTKDLHVRATQAVITAMQSQAPKPYITLTGTGVRTPGDIVTLQDRALTIGIKLLDPARLRDGKRAYALLSASPIPWTVLRVAKLTNDKRSGTRLSLHGPAQTFVSRIDVAYAILEILESQKFTHSAPILARVQHAA